MSINSTIKKIKHDIKIAIIEREADQVIFHKVGELLRHAHSPEWVLENVLSNLIMDKYDLDGETSPQQFMERLSGEVIEGFAL